VCHQITISQITFDQLFLHFFFFFSVTALLVTHFFPAIGAPKKLLTLAPCHDESIQEKNRLFPTNDDIYFSWQSFSFVCTFFSNKKTKFIPKKIYCVVSLIASNNKCRGSASLDVVVVVDVIVE